MERGRLDMTVLDVTARCRGEFLEMPGMRLTLPQAARFLGIDIATCERALEQLVDSGFLRKTGSAYTRSGVVRD